MAIIMLNEHAIPIFKGRDCWGELASPATGSPMRIFDNYNIYHCNFLYVMTWGKLNIAACLPHNVCISLVYSADIVSQEDRAMGKCKSVLCAGNS